MAVTINRRPSPVPAEAPKADTEAPATPEVDQAPEAPQKAPRKPATKKPTTPKKPAAKKPAAKKPAAKKAPAKRKPAAEPTVQETLPKVNPEVLMHKAYSDLAPEDTDILAALHAHATGTRLGTLMLVRNRTGEGFMVQGFDIETSVVNLMAPDQMELRPMVTRREAALYTPVWR